jgi:PAS domain S-box-containing protein
MISVIYVDDEPALLEVSKIFLERGGDFRVDTAGSAREGLDRIAKTQYDAIVSDYQMPEMDGIAFLKKVRAAGNTTPFIIFTGRGREEVAIEALNNGADFYLQKGGDPHAQFAELTHKILQSVNRRRAEQEVITEREKFEQYLHVVNVIVVALDIAGHVVLINQKGLETLGYLREEIVGKNWFDLCIPENNRSTDCSLHEKIIKGDLTSAEYYESDVVTKSGDLRTIAWHNAYVRNDDGAITGSISSGIDITHHKQIEAALRESEERYRTLAESANDMIYVTDTNGVLLYANTLCAEMFRTTPAQLIGKSQEELFPPDIARRHREAIRRLLENGNPGTLEEFIPTPNGNIWIYEHSAPVRDKQGNIVSVLGIARDITRQKKADEICAIASKKLKTLSSVSRHDINNKLTILSGYTELMKADTTDKTFLTYFAIQENAIKDITGILKFSKDRDSIGTEAPRWQDVHNVIAQSLQWHETAPIVITDETKGLQVYADPMLIQVFLDLIDNAMRHGKASTSIHIWHERRGDDRIIIFEDNGGGIPVEQKEKIFEMKYGRSFGLGLFLCREILSLTGLEIHETGIPGTGARFEIRLPKEMYQEA